MSFKRTYRIRIRISATMYNARVVYRLYSVLSIFYLLSAGLLTREMFVKATMNMMGGDRIGGGHSCSDKDIEIVQGASSPLPSGIPTYTVTILNACASGCNIFNIHLSCGWFSSAQIIDPALFRRLAYNDCLVNNGRPLAAGQSLAFQYANTYRYPLLLSSLVCL